MPKNEIKTQKLILSLCLKEAHNLVLKEKYANMINTVNVNEDNHSKQTESNIKTKVAGTLSFVGLRLYGNIKSYMHKSHEHKSTTV